MSNHYVELTNVPLMGSGKVLVCLEDISILRDFGADGVGITLRTVPYTVNRDGKTITLLSRDTLECTESYATVFALLDKAVKESMSQQTNTPQRGQLRNTIDDSTPRADTSKGVIGTARTE